MVADRSQLLVAGWLAHRHIEVVDSNSLQLGNDHQYLDESTIALTQLEAFYRPHVL